MKRLEPRQVIKAASAMYVVYHVGLYAAAVVGAYAYPEALTRSPVTLLSLPSYYLWLSRAALLVLIAFPFAVSWELLRHREWGRRWFVRWPAIELVMGTSLAELVSWREPMPAGLAVGYALVGIGSAAFFVAKQWLRSQLARPDVRRLLH